MHCRTGAIWSLRLDEPRRQNDTGDLRGANKSMEQKRDRRYKLLAIVLSCLSILLCGCRIGNADVVLTTSLSDDEVFCIGKKTVSISEAKVYLCNYQNIYGSAYGMNLWENKSHREKLQQYVKDVALSEMTRIVTMAQLAREKDIALSEEEQALVEQAAEAYYDSLTEEELDYMNVRQSAIESLYEDYMLAQKVYDTLTEGVNQEVSDDEARVMEAGVIYVKEQSRAAEVQNQLNSGREYMVVAADYNEAAESDMTFGRGTMPPEVDEVAFQMEDGQVSECISTGDGYYFLHCINKYNQELTDSNKSRIVKKREQDAFDAELEAFVADLSSDLNENVWEELSLQTDGSITTCSFFTVFDRYCGDGK